MVTSGVFNKKEWISDLEYQSEIESTTDWFAFDAIFKYRNSTAVVIIVNNIQEVQLIKVADKGMLRDIVIDFFDNNNNSCNKLKILYTTNFKSANVVYERLLNLYNINIV